MQTLVSAPKTLLHGEKVWCFVRVSCPKTHRVDVESVGADERDCILQIVVLDSVLVILIGHHGQSQRAHWVLAQVGQFHFQAHGVTHFTVSDHITVTGLPVHQHI